MSEAAAKQFNINPYFTVYSSLLGAKRRLTLNALLVCGEFASFSGKEKDGKITECTRRKSTLVKITRTSRATVYRAMKALTSKELEAVEGKPDTYVFKNGENHEIFIRIDKRLINDEFDIYDEETKQIIERRHLTPAEIFIAGLIITRCDNRNNESRKKTFETTNKEIAEELGIAESTVTPAIKVLKGAKIIVRKSEDVGKNQYKKSTYSINHKYKRVFKTKQEKKRKDAPDTTPQTTVSEKKHYLPSWESNEVIKHRKQIAAQESVFYEAKHAVEDIVEKARLRARSDEQFRKADEELITVAIEIAKAEIKAADGKAPEELYNREAYLQKLRREALERLGLTESDLEVPDEYSSDARGSPPSEAQNGRCRRT